MVRARFSLCVAATALLARHAAAEHPVGKVIGLLQKLGEQVKTEHQAEEVTFTKFERWCANSRSTLGKAIEGEKSVMDRLESEIESHTKNVEVLGKGITQHEQEIQELDVTEGKATQQRDDGKSLYAEESASLKNTITAIDEAIVALTDAKTTTGGFLLVQQRVQAALAFAGSRATPQQLAVLQRLAQAPAPVKAQGDQAAHVDEYAFKSDNVIDLLKELKLKFEDDLTAANTAETNALNAFELEKTARDQLRAATVAAKTEKEQAKGEAETAKAQAEGDYQNTKADLEADTTSLSQTEKACDVKKSEWAERSETRAKEQEAIEAAIKILSKVTGVRTEAPTNPGLPPSPLAAQAPSAGLLQQGAAPGAAQRALTLLRSEAKAEHSKALEKLADSLASRMSKKGPFDDIINMIQKMIFREMHDQTTEDEHKAWCDLELNKTNASIEDKQGKMEELNLKIQERAASALQLQKEIKEAEEMVGKINQHMEEATEIRNLGKQENKVALKEAREAQVALANAVAVLKEFYQSSGQIKESFELLQRRVNAREHAPIDLPETPSTWDSGYTGVADPSKQPEGIVAVLEQVSADFSRMASETEAQESSDQAAYAQDMKDCDIEKARRTKESEMKDQERKRIMEQQAQMQDSHKVVKGEIEATEQYWKDLQPACVEGDSTYEERKAARATTIEALKTAQEILQSEGNSTQAGNGTKSFLQLRGSRN